MIGFHQSELWEAVERMMLISLCLRDVSLFQRRASSTGRRRVRRKVQKGFSGLRQHYEYIIFGTTRQGMRGKCMEENLKAPYFTHFSRATSFFFPRKTLENGFCQSFNLFIVYYLQGDKTKAGGNTILTKVLPPTGKGH